MLWVDHQNYFGPDRRRVRAALRLRERRHDDCAGTPPPLTTALRQLRMRVIEARGPGAAVFADRAHSVALLAQMNSEYEASDTLSSLAMTAVRARESDVRPILYEGLDRAHAALQTYH
jgi:hypothetical protein